MKAQRASLRVLVVVVLALTACAQDPDQEPPSQRQGAPGGPATLGTPRTKSGCTNQDAALARGTRSGGSLEGDIDGDSEPDKVELVVDLAGVKGCQAFLLAVLEQGRAASPLAWDPEGGLPQPRLSSLVEVNGDPGREIVVDLAAGASTQFAGLFTFSEGSLRQVRIEGRGAPETFPDLEGLFAYGGSVGHIEAVDCIEPNGLVISAALPKGAGYEIQRHFYTASESRLIPEGAQTARSASEADLSRYPEFAASPFGSCRS